MNRIQLACFALLASALVLAGLLVSNGRQVLPEAQAALVIAEPGFSFMTAETRRDEEALFVIVNDKLMIYTTSLTGARGRVELVSATDLSRLFSGTDAGGGATGGGRAPR